MNRSITMVRSRWVNLDRSAQRIASRHAQIAELSGGTGCAAAIVTEGERPMAANAQAKVHDAEHIEHRDTTSHDERRSARDPRSSSSRIQIGNVQIRRFAVQPIVFVDDDPCT
jgi:hypothetical protein